MSIKNKTNIFIIAIIAVILSLFIFRSNTLYKSTSPNDQNIIIVKYSNAFSFGHSHIHIISKRAGLTNFLSSSKYKTSISNDGKILDKSNVTISWTDDNTALVTLIGEEQDPELITVKFRPDIIYE